MTLDGHIATSLDIAAIREPFLQRVYFYSATYTVLRRSSNVGLKLTLTIAARGLNAPNVRKAETAERKLGP